MSLEQAMYSLTQEIGRSYQTRNGSVQQIRTATREGLKESAATVSAMANQRQTEATRLHSGLHKFHLTLSKGHAELRANVGAERQELVRAHRTMAQGQRAGLAKHRAGLNKERATLVQLESGRRSQFNGWLTTIATDRAMAHKEWLGVGTAKAGREAEKPQRNSGPVFEYLASHPDGTRLKDMENTFQLGRPQLGGLLSELVNEGKVEKRGALYFAI